MWNASQFTDKCLISMFFVVLITFKTGSMTIFAYQELLKKLKHLKCLNIMTEIPPSIFGGISGNVICHEESGGTTRKWLSIPGSGDLVSGDHFCITLIRVNVLLLYWNSILMNF